ncbi:hypothetical protein ACH4U6_17180 [Streptomyces netropsis]|uniref:Secreted protein n=1 Tax=Streptomyces netropsis TaxID=55404 RepID=A0A7W7PFE1_STRNE|nr:hypothetical protein [Streptomyces netropsis]MBB4887989.1 hypothetical protein [Streptomyces netropsis]GGR32868.1 hypothetical protein GCM10010219_42160 [Streptomyces netropsis]
MSRKIALTVAACIAAGTSLIAAPAHASVRDASTQASAPASAPAAASGSDRVKCTSMSNGQLCISLNTSPSRIEVFYTKKAGSTIQARLGFRTNTADWGPWKTISTGERANTTWNMSYPCNKKYVGLLQANGQTFETPAAGPTC